MVSNPNKYCVPRPPHFLLLKLSEQSFLTIFLREETDHGLILFIEAFRAALGNPQIPAKLVMALYQKVCLGVLRLGTLGPLPRGAGKTDWVSPPHCSRPVQELSSQVASNPNWAVVKLCGSGRLGALLFAVSRTQ